MFKIKGHQLDLTNKDNDYFYKEEVSVTPVHFIKNIMSRTGFSSYQITNQILLFKLHPNQTEFVINETSPNDNFKVFVKVIKV